MVQCEMCGAETSSPRAAKIEGAELEVCGDCADFGTEIGGSDDGGKTTTKYSTSGSSQSSTSASSGSRTTATSSAGSSQSRGGNRGDDMFKDIDQVVSDYDERIRDARESAGLSQAELADQLNEKASFIRKLERGESLPNDTLQRKLERALDISLTSGSEGDEDTEWSSDAATSGVTLGDVVERKD